MDSHPRPEAPPSARQPSAAPATSSALAARVGPFLDAVPDGVVVVDGEGRIVLFSRHAERLFGYDASELLGAPVERLIPADVGTAHEARRAAHQRAPHARPMGSGLLLWGLRRDGQQIPVEVSLGPLEDPELGALVVCAVRDVSEREWARAALLQQRAELELASRAQQRFFASMSHELRTPLNAIVGFTGLLLMRLPGPLVPEQERQLQLVEKSAHELLTLIDALLREAAEPRG